MLEKNAAKLLLKNGFYLTHLPVLPVETLEMAFRLFLSKGSEYKQQYLQKEYGYAFDGYSYLGQQDSSNQAYDDLVYTFVLSNFHAADAFPQEFQPFFATLWSKALDVVAGIEQELIAQLGLPRLDTFYNNHLGHMVSCNYYPPTQSFANYAANHTRLSAHNDISLFTIFPFGLAEGFVYEDESGNWISLPACDKVLIFPGYLLEYWTEQNIRALNHQVKLPEHEEQDRTSFAYFSLPRPQQHFRLMHTDQQHTSEQYFEAYLAQF